MTTKLRLRGGTVTVSLEERSVMELDIEEMIECPRCLMFVEQDELDAIYEYDNGVGMYCSMCRDDYAREEEDVRDSYEEEIRDETNDRFTNGFYG